MSATLTQPLPSTGDALALLSQLQYLTLPQTAVRCLETINAADPAVVAHLLCKVVASDPPLTARLLGVANSAFFALPRPVFELRIAVMNVLGLDLARNLALSMAMNACFDVRRCQALDLRRYWTTALLTAHLAAERSSLPPGYEPPTGAPELCGLLCSLGLLALAHVAPLPVNEALRRSTGGQSLSAALHDVVGVDHRHALELIVGRWKLPPLIAEVCGTGHPGGGHAAYLRPLVERAHGRARAWWEAQKLTAVGTGEAAPRPPTGSGGPSRSALAADATPAGDLSPAQQRAAERLLMMVESCVPMH